MTQPNKKVDYGDHIDRISELPGNVIDCILKLLNIRDLIRTSILSRKWRYTWNSVPRIKFDERFYNLFDKHDDPASESSKIITEILFLHHGPINEFIHSLTGTSKHKITYEYINKWILFLSRKDVKYIFMENYEEHLVGTPSHLFSCHGLTYLKLKYFNMSIPPNFCGFKSLLHLHLQFILFEPGALESLLSGCPLLEKLSIVYCYGYECIDISSCTLTDLTLSIEEKCILRLNKSLPIIQRLKVDLAHGVLFGHADIFPLSQLINLKYLSLYNVNLDEREELLYIVSVLKSASNLVEFRIETYYYDFGRQVPDPSEKVECSCCCLSELQEVNILVRSSSKHAMSLARFILANSSSLKTLTVKLPFRLDAPVVSSISRDLLWMQRASQKAQVKFIHT